MIIYCLQYCLSQGHHYGNLWLSRERSLAICSRLYIEEPCCKRIISSEEHKTFSSFFFSSRKGLFGVCIRIVHLYRVATKRKPKENKQISQRSIVNFVKGFFYPSKVCPSNVSSLVCLLVCILNYCVIATT